MTVKYIQRNKK